MSEILQKFKRKPLLEELQERFPIENIEPYGSCLIVPLKAFNKTQEEKLKSQGLRIYYQGYKGQTSAFIVLEKQVQRETVIEESSIEEPSEAKSEKKPKIGLWTSEEKVILKQLLCQGVPIKEIALQLGRSVYSVGAEIAHLPELKRKYARKPKEEPSEAKSKTDDPDIVKEFLEASAILYPSHKTACAFLLKAASDRIMENRQSP